MKISPARTCAFDVLLRVEKDRVHSSVLLAERESSLEPRDRGLCHEIVLGTLRNLILLDTVIETLSSKKIGRLDPEVLVALRMGLYQIRFLDKVPEYAAVKESVELVLHAGKRSARGFTNAILRKAAREWPEAIPEGNAERLSVLYSHPAWLVERWIGKYGPGETEELLRYNNTAPKASFRFTKKFDLLTSEEKSAIFADLVDDGKATRSEIVQGSYIASGRTRNLSSLSEEGLVYFQDEGSQLIALASVPSSGSFLDLCAAPGSKTTFLARYFDYTKGVLAACDLNSGRTDVLKRICREQGAGFVRVVRADAELELPFSQGSFDTVLVDAPCTGTGTIAQNPELRYFIKPSDIERLAKKQLRILENASKCVKPGGLMIYSTCSLEEEENEGVAKRFLGSNQEFRSEPPRVAERYLSSDGFARTVPQWDGTSGFFIAAFRRSE